MVPKQLSMCHTRIFTKTRMWPYVCPGSPQTHIANKFGKNQSTMLYPHHKVAITSEFCINEIHGQRKTDKLSLSVAAIPQGL
mgnify:CR=1 FL=1